jgi:beta-glucosidase
MDLAMGDSFQDRAKRLIEQMTLDEKCAQLTYAAPAVPRLGIAAYNWWNECLHGVGRAGLATVFPQAIGLAATFDVDLMYRVASATADEARAKHHAHAAQDDFGIYKGLTFWTPNINIFRDPRWGRGHETYGECPYLTSRLGVAFVRGLQGDDPVYLKLVATPKHMAVHSGPEAGRHSFNAVVSDFDLYDTYLPAFRATVTEAKAYSVMGAYNRLNGVPCCANDFLLNHCLREKWGFDGYTVSDCGALTDLHAHHKLTRTAAESAALAINNGLDLCCGQDFEHLREAVDQGLVSEQTIERSLLRLLKARMKLGMFDPPDKVKFTRIPYEVVDSQPHRQLALEAAQRSIVLLKNQGAILPLSLNIQSIAVIGPNADAAGVQLGNYHGTPSYITTIARGICEKVDPRSRVWQAVGTTHLPTSGPWLGTESRGLAEAIVAAQRSEIVVLCLGLNSLIEGEEGDAMNSDAAGDRTAIELPAIQQRLLEAIVAVGKPVILILMGGSAMAVPFGHDQCAAVLQQFYPGQSGGVAMADVLFGDFNPCGRLPITVYRATSDLPDFRDYSMAQRTYRYFQGTPLYPFGFGLSYSKFEYSDLRLSSSKLTKHQPLEATVCVRNAGGMAGGEIAQLYLSHMNSGAALPRRVPLRALTGIAYVELPANASTTICFTIASSQFHLIDESGHAIFEPGEVRLWIGGSQPDSRSAALGATMPVSSSVQLL